NKLCVLCIGNFRAIHRESSDRHSVRWRFLRWAIRAPHLERAAGDGYQVRFDCFTTFGLIRIGGLLAWRRRIISRSAGPRHEVDATTSTDQHYEADDSGYERDGRAGLLRLGGRGIPRHRGMNLWLALPTHVGLRLRPRRGLCTRHTINRPGRDALSLWLCLSQIRRRRDGGGGKARTLFFKLASLTLNTLALLRQHALLFLT